MATGPSAERKTRGLPDPTYRNRNTHRQFVGNLFDVHHRLPALRKAGEKCSKLNGGSD
jgi:hypothetical protein